METQEMTITILNDLIQINNDRVEGYEKAIKELKEEDSDLKLLFTNMIAESHHYKMALGAEVTAMGEETDSDTTKSGKIYRVWMDIRAAFSGHDRKTVLANCEFGEDAAQKAYEMALKEDDLAFNIHTLISDQKQSLRTSHDKIKALRDA